LARAALLADLKKNDFDSKHDSWGVKLTEDAPVLFEQGKLKVVVTDLSGLLQVNALVPDKKKKQSKPKQPGQLTPQQQQQIQINLWKRLLMTGNFVADESEALKIIDAIIDWIDNDDNENNNNGAESGYYLSLSPAYSARNAPIVYLEELLLIRGMTEEIFSGIKEYLTEAGSDGMININSAPKGLLMVLDPLGNMTEQTRDDLVEFRQEESNKGALSRPDWYKRVNGSLDLEQNQKGLIGVKSNYFKVSVIAKHKNMTRTGTGILERVDGSKDEQKLLYWEVR